MTAHTPRVCVRRQDSYRAPSHFSANHANGSASYEFRCPQCNRAGRFNICYLGKNAVVCNGLKFERRPMDLKLAVAEHDSADAQPYSGEVNRG